MARSVWAVAVAVILLAGATQAAPAKAKSPPKPPPAPKYAYTDLNSSFVNQTLTIALQAFTAAGLDQILNSPNDTATYFIPTDAAFQAALSTLQTSQDALLTNIPLLTDILKLHVIQKHHFFLKDIGRKGRIATSWEGAPLTISHYKQTIRVKGGNTTAMVTLGDVRIGKSAVMHIVDTVMIPPSGPTLASVLTTNGDLSFTIQAYQAAGLTSVLNDQFVTGTFFLANNQAWNTLMTNHHWTVGYVLGNVPLLNRILGYGRVPGAGLLIKNLQPNQQLNTLLLGQNITVTFKKVPIGQSRAFITTEAGQTAHVVDPNISVGKAVVHLVDLVPLPSPILPPQ